MPKPLLVIVTGHPGSGKTTLARQLSERLHIPYVSKDALKERMFDALGSSDKAWSLKVSGASHRIVDDIIGQILQSGSSVIVESNFKVKIDSQRFAALVKKYHAGCLQILCQASGEVLFDRWTTRIQQGERHEGHVEAISLEQIKQDLTLPYEPLSLPGELITLDTSDVSKLELPRVIALIKNLTRVP